MKTFNQEMKNRLVAEMERHAELDMIQQGAWFVDGKGCHIGCCGHSLGLTGNKPHWKELSEKTGIPQWILKLSERIFEGLDKDDAKIFSLDFCKAIPTDTNLNAIRPTIEVARLERLKDIQSKSNYKDKREIIYVLDLGISIWKDDNTTGAQRSEIEAIAGAAVRTAQSVRSTAIWSARSTTESAVRSSEALTAEAIAEAAIWSTRSAAEAEAGSGAGVWSADAAVDAEVWLAWSLRAAWSEAAVRSACWKKEAKTLLEAMRGLSND